MGNVWPKSSEDDVQSKGAVPLHSSDVDVGPVLSSRDDLKRFIASEITKVGTAIEAGFDAFLERREEKILELEKKNERLEKENNKFHQQFEQLSHFINELQRQYHSLKEQCGQEHEELEEERQNNDNLTREIKKLQDVNRDLDQELQKADETILKLKELTDPTREMRRKGQSVRPGDVTHKDVAKDFKNLYTQRDLLKHLGMTKQDQRSPFLTQLFNCAYDVCKTSIIEIAKAELGKLFVPPEYLFSEDERANSDIYLPWKDRQEALSLLLSLDEDKKRSLPPSIISKVEEEMRSQVLIDGEIKEVTAKVTELAWSMVTLSPPVTFDERLQTFSEDIHESFNPHGISDDDIKQGKYTIKYRRPVLYFGSLGTIGEKGSVALIPITETLQNNELPLLESPENSLSLDKGSSSPSCAVSSNHEQAAKLLNTSMETTSCSSNSGNQGQNVEETKCNIALKMIADQEDTQNMESVNDEIEKASNNNISALLSNNKIENCEENENGQKSQPILDTTSTNSEDKNHVQSSEATTCSAASAMLVSSEPSHDDNQSDNPPSTCKYDSENQAGNKKNSTDYDKNNVEASPETSEQMKTQQLDNTEKEVMDDTMPSGDLNEKKKKERKRKKKTKTTNEDVLTREVDTGDQEASSDNYDSDRSLD